MGEIFFIDSNRGKLIVLDTNGKKLRESDANVFVQTKELNITSNGRIVHVDRTHISIFK